MKYQTKPVEVEAKQWRGPNGCTGDYLADFQKWVEMKDSSCGYRIHGECAVITLKEVDFDGNQFELILRPNEYLVDNPTHGLLAYGDEEFKNFYEGIE